MIKEALALAVLLLVVPYIFDTACVSAQDPSGERDTFFLSKKKGLLGKLGKSISTDPFTAYSVFQQMSDGVNLKVWLKFVKVNK